MNVYSITRMPRTTKMDTEDDKLSMIFKMLEDYQQKKPTRKRGQYKIKNREKMLERLKRGRETARQNRLRKKALQTNDNVKIEVKEIKPEPEPKVEVIPEPKVEVIPEPKVEVIPETKVEVEVKSEPKVEVKPEVEVIPETKVEVIPQTILTPIRAIKGKWF